MRRPDREPESAKAAARFREEGEGAKTADRTGLQNLLQCRRLHKGNVQFVVISNLTRFALENYDHFALRALVKSLGISLHLATEPTPFGSRVVLRDGRICTTRSDLSGGCPGCRAKVNVTKAKLEGLFADELALLQPTPGYMRLLKESVMQIWKARKAAVREEIDSAERAAKTIQNKLDRLDEAFLFERSIDIDTYDRHAEKLREEFTLARMDRHSGQLDELDVEGILAFAERVLPRAADLWVQASLEQRQRFQQLFFPNGIAFDGKGFVGTRVTAPAFSYLRTIERGNERMVDQMRASWNQIVSWFRRIDALH